MHGIRPIHRPISWLGTKCLGRKELSLRFLSEEATLNRRDHAARQPLAKPGDKRQRDELEIGLRSLWKIEGQYLGLEDGKYEQTEGDTDHGPHRPDHPKQAPVGPGEN